MINSMTYARGYLEWGIAYTFPWKKQSTLRFNLNSPNFKDERNYWKFYVGNISHEEVDIQIYRAAGRKAWKDWHNFLFGKKGLYKKVPKRVSTRRALGYDGYISDFALNAIAKRYRRRR